MSINLSYVSLENSFKLTWGAFDSKIWIQIFKSGFRICNRTRNPKTDFNAEISVLDFHFYRSIGKSEKGFEKLSLRTAVLHALAYQQKEDHCSREQFCKSFFGFPNRTVKRKSMKSGFGFLNWNGFLGGEIRYRISRSIRGQTYSANSVLYPIQISQG